MKYSPLYDSACVAIGSNGFKILEQPKYASEIAMTKVIRRKSGWMSVQYLDKDGDIVAESGAAGLREWYPMIGKVMEVEG